MASGLVATSPVRMQVAILNRLHSQRSRRPEDHFLCRRARDLACRPSQASNDPTIAGRSSQVTQKLHADMSGIE